MYFKTLIKPILTEKMAILQERENKYAFFVPKTCNKNTIKNAVESKFDVKVIKVSTMNKSGKLKKMKVKSSCDLKLSCNQFCMKVDIESRSERMKSIDLINKSEVN